MALLQAMKYEYHCHLMVDVVNNDQNVVFEDSSENMVEMTNMSQMTVRVLSSAQIEPFQV